MRMPVRIEKTLYQDAKTHAKAECRTIAGQIEFWAKVGKAALDNPDPNEFPSPADLEDADDILHAHLPRQVLRVECGCGEPWPCAEVRFAELVKRAA